MLQDRQWNKEYQPMPGALSLSRSRPTQPPVLLVTRAIFPQILDRLHQVFEVRSNQADDAWSPEELRARARDCDALMTTPAEQVDAALLAACPRLRMCANVAVGFNNFDVQAMTAQGVLATNTPGVLTESTADFAFALLMATARRITESEQYLREGRWQRWRYDILLGQDVHGATLGILGMGRIGQAVARRAALGFGMPVLYHNRRRLPEAEERACKARFVEFDALLQAADFLLLALPLTPENRHIIGARELRRMQPHAMLINIARGGIVDDAALAEALRTGAIAGAGLDVFENEPHVHPDLLAQHNVVLTPHAASATRATRLAMARLAADNLMTFFTRGHALTALNPEVLATPFHRT